MTETVDVALPTQRGPHGHDAAIAAFHRVWAEMCLACTSGSYAVADGVAAARTGLPVPPFNGVLGLTTDVDDQAVLTAVDDFAAGDLPWNVQLRPGFSNSLAQAFADRGLVQTAAIPFMVSTTAPAMASAAPAMRPLDCFNDLESAITLLEQGFGMPPALSRGGFSLRMLLLEGSTTWIARAEDVDVSTALGAVAGDHVGIFNVATPEAYRGCGFGAAVTTHAILAGMAAGASVAYLQASPMGYPVYKKLGFSTVERWQQWMPSAYLS